MTFGLFDLVFPPPLLLIPPIIKISIVLELVTMGMVALKLLPLKYKIPLSYTSTGEKAGSLIHDEQAD